MPRAGVFVEPHSGHAVVHDLQVVLVDFRAGRGDQSDARIVGDEDRPAVHFGMAPLLVIRTVEGRRMIRGEVVFSEVLAWNISLFVYE